MSIPDAPQTRGEEYLNAIATGDNSGIPDAPQTRMEQYLDVIAKSGGGGGGGTEPLAVEMVMEDGTLELEMEAVDIYNAYPNVYAYMSQDGMEAHFPILFAVSANGEYNFGVSLSTSGSYMINTLTSASGDDYPSGSLN